MFPSLYRTSFSWLTWKNKKKIKLSFVSFSIVFVNLTLFSNVLPSILRYLTSTGHQHHINFNIKSHQHFPSNSKCSNCMTSYWSSTALRSGKIIKKVSFDLIFVPLVLCFYQSAIKRKERENIFIQPLFLNVCVTQFFHNCSPIYLYFI